MDITKHEQPYGVVGFHFYGDGVTGILGVLASAIAPFHMLDQLIRGDLVGWQLWWTETFNRLAIIREVAQTAPSHFQTVRKALAA